MLAFVLLSFCSSTGLAEAGLLEELKNLWLVLCGRGCTEMCKCQAGWSFELHLIYWKVSMLTLGGLEQGAH